MSVWSLKVASETKHVRFFINNPSSRIEAFYLLVALHYPNFLLPLQTIVADRTVCFMYTRGIDLIVSRFAGAGALYSCPPELVIRVPDNWETPDLWKNETYRSRLERYLSHGRVALSSG